MELKVIVNPIDGAAPGKGLLSNLFYGCGYNFYRSENEFQEDDELIRGKLSQLLQESRAHLSSLERALSREHRARDYAFPNAAAVATAQALLCAQRDLEAMEALIDATSAPQMHRLPRPHRQERSTLCLVALDGEVLLALLTLRDAIAKFENGAAAVARMAGLLRASDFDALWNRRETLLSGGLG